MDPFSLKAIDDDEVLLETLEFLDKLREIGFKFRFEGTPGQRRLIILDLYDDEVARIEADGLGSMLSHPIAIWILDGDRKLTPESLLGAGTS